MARMGYLYLPTGIKRKGIFMKEKIKRIVMGFVFMAVVFFVTACSSSPKRFIAVKDIPQDELCQLMLQTNYITITSFNGSSVNWQKGAGGALREIAEMAGGGTRINLPAGTHTLAGNYYDGTRRANGISITYVFKAGTVYLLDIQSQGGGLFSSATASFNITEMANAPVIP